MKMASSTDTRNAAVSISELAGCSGLELVERLADGSVRRPSMAEALPFTLLPPEQGKVGLLATPEARFCNLTNTVHGGWTMTMLDTAMSLAAEMTLGWRNMSITRNHRQICPPDIGQFRRHARHRPGGFARPDRHHAGGQDRGCQRQASRSWHVDVSGREAVMPAFSTANRAPSERRLMGGTLFLLAGLASLGALATNIILPAFPRIGAELAISSPELGLLLSSFFVAFALGQLVVGPLSDRFGRKPLVLGGLAVFAAGSVLCALAGNLPLVVLGRVIQALGACAASVLSRAIARDLFDGEALGRALALTMIAGAAAPGFSPLLGSILAGLFGWRMIFFIVAAFGMVLALHYLGRIGETHPVGCRTPLAFSAVASAYGRLAADPRFLLPALAVSLVIGGLYSFFAAAPGVLMTELGLTAFQLGLSFAATVLIVFVAGFLAPRLAHRWGQRAIGMIGLFIALAGGVAMFAFAAAPAFTTFTMAIALYLFGMGLINPLGTAIALNPFGHQAGLASALLGFLQMGCAAIGASFASALPFPPSVSLAVVLTTGSALAFLVFLPVALRQPQVELGNSSCVSESAGG